MDVVDFRIRFRTEHMLGPWNPDDPAPHFSQYIELYKMRPRLTQMDMPEYVAMMKRGGVSRGVVCGGSIEDNDHLMEVRESLDDDPFYYIAGVHPKYGVRRNLEELERCRQAGFLGANISPYIWGVPANASVLYPIYAYCEATTWSPSSMAACTTTASRACGSATPSTWTRSPSTSRTSSW